MANDLRMSNAAVDAEGDALAPLFNSGYLRIYSGTRPATADAAVGVGPVLLAELRYAASAVATSVNGLLTFDTITAEDAALADGTAAWFRDLESDGTTAICDGEVGTTGCDLNLSTVAIVTGAAVSVTSKTHTIPKATA